MTRTANNTVSKNNRKEQILQALALELEQRPGERITTANLAKAVGVSEAALYRHFPSKAKMFEGLIEFSEDTVFGMINKVLEEQEGILDVLHRPGNIGMHTRQMATVITRLALTSTSIAG